jgi:hypothetical protein
MKRALSEQRHKKSAFPKWESGFFVDSIAVVKAI